MNEAVAKVTLARVADRAGVSIPTVSKVLNGRDDVAERTRRRVWQAAKELGYASPKQQRSAPPDTVMIDLVINRLESAYSIEVLRGVVDMAAQEQAEIVVSTGRSKETYQSDGQRWAQRLASSGRRGLILVTSEVDPAQLDSFVRQGVPVVLIDPLNEPQGAIPTVGATNWSGGKAAAEHLLALGHRRIAYIGGPEHAECNQARLHGYMAAMMGRGIDIDPRLIHSGSFEPETGAAGLRALLKEPSPPSAIFAGSDTIALGVIGEAYRQRILVPNNLSVVGFDGTAVVEQSVPQLTSVAQPMQEIGRTALRMVLQLARGEAIDSDHVELATHLVIRGSTAPYK